MGLLAHLSSLPECSGGFNSVDLSDDQVVGPQHRVTQLLSFLQLVLGHHTAFVYAALRPTYSVVNLFDLPLLPLHLLPEGLLLDGEGVFAQEEKFSIVVKQRSSAPQPHQMVCFVGVASHCPKGRRTSVVLESVEHMLRRC